MSARRYAEHPLAIEALDEVKAAVGRFHARRDEPVRWALFHGRMAAALPPSARLRRAWHRAMARRYRAHAHALGSPACCLL